MDIEKLIADSDKEVNGVWVPIGDGGEILVAREGNEEYEDYLHNLATANRAAIDQNDKASRKLQRELVRRAYAHTILKGIRGIKRGGVEITNFDTKVAMELLSIPDFFKKVQSYAQQFDLYQKQGEDAAVKN